MVDAFEDETAHAYGEKYRLASFGKMSVALAAAASESAAAIAARVIFALHTRFCRATREKRPNLAFFLPAAPSLRPKKKKGRVTLAVCVYDMIIAFLI